MSIIGRNITIRGGILPSVDLKINNVNEGTFAAGSTINVNLTDGVNPVTSNDVTVVGNTVTVEVEIPDWIRPSDWLVMPTVVATDDTFVGLHAVIEDNDNFCAFRFTTSTGDYQVDWGDGTVTTHASNTNAEHQYDFATYDPTNATLTSRGYKQAIITVTPVTGNLLTCSFQQRFVTVPAQTTSYSTGFLDCILSMPNASSGASIVFGGTTVRHSYVERVNVLTIGACTSMASMFFNCLALQSVPLFDTANVTNMGAMFVNCFSLQSVPLFNTQNVTSMPQLFQSCWSLKSVPLFNTQNVTNMFRLVSGCDRIQSVPLFNTANVTNMEQMFSGCYSLQTVPLFNTTNVTNMSAMFQNCWNLQSVPLFDTSNVTNMSAMFRDIFGSLNSIPALSTASITPSAGTDFSNFANNSNSLNRCQMVFARTVSFSNCQLSRDALVEIFTNLVDRTSTTSANIDITNNWGATALSTADRDIALNKNWTITG